MTLVFVTVAIAVIVLVALMALGRVAGPPDAQRDRHWPPLSERGVEAADLGAVRFSLGFRGYRMDQVDQVMDAAGVSLAAKAVEIADLKAQLASQFPIPQAGG